MGLFDYFRSSYNLGEQFTNVELHTKDIEDGIGGTMTNYWLDPSGRLWCPSYIGTHTFEEISKDDERYNDKARFLNFEWIPTGAHGRYHVHPITKYIVVYPAEWGESWESWPRCRIHLVNGKVQDFTVISRSK